MPYRGESRSGPVNRGATTPHYRGEVTHAAAAPKPPVHHGLWHDITHPGLAEIASVISPIALPSYLAAHSHVPGLTQAGRAVQGLVTSPEQVIAHPKSATKNLGSMVVGLGEFPYAITKSIKGQGGKDTLTNMWKGMKLDYQRRYGPNWEAEARKSPLFNLADLLIVLGPATKVATLAAATRNLGELSRLGETARALGERGAIIKGGRSTRWADLSAREKLRVARAESKQPGLYTTGKAKTRVISAKLSDEGAPLPIEQPLSSSPVRRAIQQAFDDISRAYPGMPGVGAGGRVVRATARQMSRANDRLLATIPGAENLQKIGTAGRVRAFWEANVASHAVDDAGNILHNHAIVTAKLKELHAALSHEYSDPAWKMKLAEDDPELANALDVARKRGYGKVLINELEQAIRYKPGKHYERAIESLKHASTVGEQIIQDTEGFSTLNNAETRLKDRLEMLGDDPAHAEEVARVHEQLANVSEQLVNKRVQVADMLVNRRRAVAEFLAQAPVDAVERRDWEKHLVNNRGWTPQQAADAMHFSDLRARVVHPDDPARYYAEQVGSPTGESAQAVQARFANAMYQTFPEHGVTPLIEMIEGDVLTPAKTSAYYSKAQKQITEEWGPKEHRQAGQVRKQFQDNVGEDEFRNAGLDIFFDQFDKNDMITQTQLYEHLATPLNQYNLHEIHTVGSQESFDKGFLTRFDNPYLHGRSLISRTQREGEYHEIVFTLPPGSETHYTGEGFTHWGIPNVTGHIRFHVFEENGVQKLVVEEIQSDWASDFRKRGGDPSLAPPPLSARRHNELAVDRVLRYAGEHGVDEVIFPEAHIQHVRNRVGVEDQFIGDEFVPGHTPLTMKTPAEVRAAMDELVGPERTPFDRMYEQQFPALAEKRLGVKGEASENAYRGHFAQGTVQSDTGPIHGTVFKLDDAARAKAVKPSPLYQRQPEWGKLPRGANEVLANGNRLIHMFQKADISTWVHELGHSALDDLSAEDRAVLHDHYGEGTESIEKWATSSHENYARDLERAVREGVLPDSRALQEVFQRIQEWMQRVYRTVKAEHPEAEIPPEVQDVFRRMFMPEHDTPDIFMPHRVTAPNLAGARMASGAPRATRSIGTEVEPRIPLFKRNRLGLLRSGMLNTDPRQLFEHVNRLVSLQKANQVREFLLEHGTPLLDPDKFEPTTQYVVKEAGTNPNKVLFNAIADSEHPDEIRQTIKEFIDNNVLDSKQKVAEAWRGDQQLYVVNKGIVDSLFKYVTGKKPGQATKPMSVGGQLADALANSIRGMLLYGNPGFYVANMVGNLGMQLFNDPRSLKYLKDGLTKRGTLYHRVNVEMGRGPTSAATAPVAHIVGREVRPIGAGRNAVVRTSNALERWNHMLGAVGRKTGAVVDDPFRYATWRQEAAKLGYKTDEQVTKLFDEAVADSRGKGLSATGTKALNDLNKIRDKSEQLMLDFDSMTPFERNWLSRVVFLYPFLKASAKYPFMFAGEHPFTFGAAAQTANLGGQFANQVLGPRPDLPLWAQGYVRTPFGMINLGSVDQMSMLASEIETGLGIGTPTPVGINRPINMLLPGLQIAIELAQSRNRYGREANAGEILRSDFPVPGWASSFYRPPSALYTDRGKFDALLRSLRLYPFGIDKQYGAGNTG